MTHLPSCKSDVSEHPLDMADNVLREAYTAFLARKAPCSVPAVGG
jgi:hypothetical protein